MDTNLTKRENIDGYYDLENLAFDFIWGWTQNHALRKIWEQLDPELWEQLRNPWTILQSISVHKLEKFLSDSNFRKMLSELIKKMSKNLTHRFGF
jgi:endonuclease III